METLIVERKDGVVTVTMNRPERKNAANGKMLTELRATFEEVEDNPDDRVMVLTGAGGAFCSGADLSDPSGPATDPTRSGLSRMRRLGDVALALHQNNPFDLVILELLLKEKDGLQTLVELRRPASPAKFIVLARPGLMPVELTLRMAEKLGAHGVLAEPYRAEALLSLVRKVLNN